MIQRHQLLVLRSMVRRTVLASDANQYDPCNQYPGDWNWITMMNRKRIEADNKKADELRRIAKFLDAVSSDVEFHPGQERAWGDFEKVRFTQMSGSWMETASELSIRAIGNALAPLFEHEHDPETLVRSNLKEERGPSPLIAAWQGWERDHRSKRP